MGSATFYHESVMLAEAIEGLDIQPSGTYVDGTLGGGGHSRAILAQLGPKGRLLVFDHDQDAWRNAPDDERVILVRENFRYLKRFLRLHGAVPVDGILVDLGVSSFQFDTAARGFSTRFDAILDMRMDVREAQTARDVLAQRSEGELQQLFEKYGEVRNARTLAAAIVAARVANPINTINDLKGAIEGCIRGNQHRYLAQVFQALRIEVNDEVGALKDFLEQTPDCLKSGGRLCVLTFHSLEDRLVKRFMKQGHFETQTPTDIFGKALIDKPFRPLPDVLPMAQEIKRNSRARSARLRIAEKL